MDLRNLNLAELDKNLSEEERREWNSIYASYRAGSLLTGTVSGMETRTVDVKNEETGEYEEKIFRYLVVIDYRVKVIIPQDEMWYEKGDIPYHVMRSMGGAKIDYVITDIDREGDFCIASRSQALRIRRHSFLKLTPRVGKRTKCDILAMGQWHLLCTVGGFDITLAARDVSYAAIPDLRERYHAGESKEALIRYYEPENMRLGISIKRAQPHPFDGADLRHPIESRRASVIMGKFAGGVYCKLEEELDCLCGYSAEQCDADFHIGDKVIIVITKYSYERRLIYGKILARW